MLEKIEVGKVYHWKNNYYFILKVDVWANRITYRVLGSDAKEALVSYDAARRILEYVS